MAGVKDFEVAGRFYPADRRSLKDEIALFRATVPQDYACTTRAVIVPQAGHIFSGKMAVAALQYLRKDTKSIFIFSPAHRASFHGIAVCDHGSFATPLGAVRTNADITAKLTDKFGCKVFNEAFAGEHAVEVQLPFLQALLPRARIVPIIAGKVDGSAIAKIIGEFWKDGGNAFLVSSDLSHFLGEDEATAMDAETCTMIENNDVAGLTCNRACGAVLCRGLAEFAGEKGFSLLRVGRHHSGKITGNGLSVVGYGAWILAETEKNKFLANNFSDYILGIDRKSVV
jgi:AmmeMemoRadiSam system protein B